MIFFDAMELKVFQFPFELPIKMMCTSLDSTFNFKIETGSWKSIPINIRYIFNHFVRFNFIATIVFVIKRCFK